MASGPASSATNPAAPATAGAAARRARIARGLVSLPDRMTTAFLAVSVVISVALLVDQFRPYLVLPACVIAVVLTRRWIPATPAAGRAAVVGTVVAVLITIAWCVVNVPLYAETMGVSRDPGQYTLFGLYLIDHPTGDVVLTQDAIDLARTVPGVSTDWNGRPPAINVPVQSTNLVPGLIGLLGWFFGPVGALRALVVVAGLCLLALYAAGRRLLGPLWALLPVVAMGLGMPLAAFGRVPYTEPAALLFGLGMITCLWAAVHQRHDRWMYALAGLFSGASVIARIDGLLALIGGVVAVGICLTATTGADRRAAVRGGLTWFCIGGGITGLLGVLDLLVHSPFYVQDQLKQFLPLLGLLVLVVLIAYLLPKWPLAGRIAGSADRRRVRWAGWFTAAVAAVLLLLASRPWWYVSRLMYDQYATATAARQKLEGLPVDGKHSYDEWTINWHAWYYGWSLVVIGGIGILLLVFRSIARRDARIAVLLTMPAVTALLYLNKVSITPDQIWAFRRMLAGVVPGLLLAAGAAVRIAAQDGPGWFAARFRRPVDDTAAWIWRGVVVAGSVVVFALPATNWGALFSVREGAGQQAFVADICSRAGDHRLVMAGGNPSFGHFLPAAQQACGLDAVRVADADPERLAAVADTWAGDGPIAVVAFDDDAVAWEGGTAPPPVAHVEYQRWEEKLMRSPILPVEWSATAWMGTLNDDGTVTPLPATG